jgi:very-short-patch-repair endonuclease
MIQKKTKYLKSCDYKMIRFWNHDVINDIDGVMFAIIQLMKDENCKERLNLILTIQ